MLRERCGHEWQDVWSTTCDDDCPACGARHMSPYKSDDVEDSGDVMDDRSKRAFAVIGAHVMNENLKRIAALNDAFRSTFAGGKVVMTAGVDALPSDVKAMLIRKAATFDEFTRDNDPYGEHDFGEIELTGRKFFWKIDYYDTAMEFGSEDPTDAAKTTRVLTIMLAEEY